MTEDRAYKLYEKHLAPKFSMATDSPQIAAMKKLAASVITIAMHDYYDAKRKLYNSGDAMFYDRLKLEQYRTQQKLEMRYAYRFLTHDSTWHQIVNIKPEFIKRKLDDPKFKFTIAVNYDRGRK